jgi:hypothetical protein
MAQRGAGKRFLRVQKNAPVAAEREFRRVQLPESFDQTGLAVEIDRVLAGGGFHLVDPILATGVVSKGCIDRNFCSAGERFLSFAFAVTLLGLTAACITQGWQGKLIGARRTSGTTS